MDIKINQKFKDLLPPLPDEDYALLEQSIIADGVRESIKLWQNQIVDGHNRFSVCQKHDLPFPSTDLHFADENAALDWIILNQLGRRNLTRNQRTYYIGELYNLRKNKVGAPEGSKNALKNNSAIIAEKEDLAIEYDEDYKPKPNQTAQKIAKEFGVSERAVEYAAKVHEAVEILPQSDKTDFLQGKITQKEVIEKAKEITSPESEKTSDEFVEAVRDQAKTVETKIRLLNEELARLQKLFVKKGVDLSQFTPSLTKSIGLNGVNRLKRLRVCGCNANCELCINNYRIWR